MAVHNRLSAPRVLEECSRRSGVAVFPRCALQRAGAVIPASPVKLCKPISRQAGIDTERFGDLPQPFVSCPKKRGRVDKSSRNQVSVN